MRRKSKVLVAAGTLLLVSGFVTSAMGVLHPFDRLMSVQEIRSAQDGVYSRGVYSCCEDFTMVHHVFYVEMDGVRGYSRGDRLIYIYDSRFKLRP